jgi:hypothetical protein
MVGFPFIGGIVALGDGYLPRYFNNNRDFRRR